MQETTLTFIIPVCHPDNARDWNEIKKNLVATMKSISSQDSNSWRAIIIANVGSDLPPLLPNFKIEYVDFPPNSLFALKNTDKEAWYSAVRFDKGRRVLSGMLSAQKTAYFMVVDCDDFVNKKLVSYINNHQGGNGWYVEKGYVWGDGGRLLYRYKNFSQLCGTSLIVRADLYNFPKSVSEANDDFIKVMCGSHVLIQDVLRERGTPLISLPFYGAVYRVDHMGSHSKAPGLIKMFLLDRNLIRNPARVVYRFFKFRYLTKRLRNDFGFDEG